MGFKFSVAKCICVVFTRRNVPDLQLTLQKPSDSKYPVVQPILKYLRGTSWGVDRKSLLMVYKSLILAHLDYGSPVHRSGSEPTLRKLDVLQNECVRMCLETLHCTRVARMEVKANIPPLQHCRDALLLSYGIKTARKASPRQRSKQDHLAARPLPHCGPPSSLYKF